MVVLHGYILRELLKVFGLSVLALTGLFTMCGGLYNVLKFEGVTPNDLFAVLPMLLPIAVTMTMPISALFAATITYGRLTADNEFIACRSAGINIHRLFMSAALLSVFVALSTAFSVNVLIPESMKQITQFARRNVRDFAFHRLLQRGYIYSAKKGKPSYTLTAKEVLNVPRDELINRGFDPPDDGVSYFWVEEPAFLMLDRNGEIERFSVAEGGLCQFDASGDTVEVTIYIKNARDYEAGKRVVQINQQKIGPYPAPTRFPIRPAMVDLTTLRRWRDRPWEEQKLADDVRAFLSRVQCFTFLEDAGRALDAGDVYSLHDAAGARYRISAAECAEGEWELILSDVEVAVVDPQRDRQLLYIAPRAKLAAVPTEAGLVAVNLRLLESADNSQRVREFHPRGGERGTPIARDVVELEELALPDQIVKQTAEFTPGTVYDAAAKLPTNERLSERRIKLVEAGEKLRRKVTSLIHFRLAFAASALVTIIMGAALGVMFRGSHVLAAFGLACIPFGVVTVWILMGRQLTESPGTAAIGPLVTWGGLALVGVTNLLLLRWGVGR